MDAPPSTVRQMAISKQQPGADQAERPRPRQPALRLLVAEHNVPGGDSQAGDYARGEAIAGLIVAVHHLRRAKDQRAR